MTTTTNTHEAVTKGLSVRLEVRHGRADEVDKFLGDAGDLVSRESDTTAWFAVRFGKDEYGIIDLFPDGKSRLKHLTGGVPRELVKHALTLLGSLPDMDKCDVLAAKMRS